MADCPLWLDCHGTCLCIVPVAHRLRRGVCTPSKQFFGKLLCTAAISVFSLQVLTYLCANCGLLISTYFPLPLLYGGNYSTLVNLLLMGILLSAVRHGSLYTDASAPQPLFDYADGTLHVHLK